MKQEIQVLKQKKQWIKPRKTAKFYINICPGIFGKTEKKVVSNLFCSLKRIFDLKDVLYPSLWYLHATVSVPILKASQLMSYD